MKSRLPTSEEFWANTMPIPESGCLIWMTGWHSDGYTVFQRTINGKTVTWLAHRYAYELSKGPIPKGLVIDHLCKVRSCVNPDHLEAVTQYVNIMRSGGVARRNRDKTHCKRGHELTGKHLRRLKAGGRQCWTCQKETVKQWKRADRARKRLGV